MKQLFLLITLGLCSCSMPSGQPSVGQQAVLASASHRVSDQDLAQQKVFMQAFLAQHPQ